MIVFASVEDLEKGWRTLSESEATQAEELLKRASAYLTALLARKGIAVDVADEVQLINLESVTCNMVQRVFESIGGVSQISQGIGATNASVSFANPDMSLYLSRSDREKLGLTTRSEYRSVHAHTFADDMRHCGGGRWTPVAKFWRC